MAEYDPSMLDFSQRWAIVPGEIMRRGLDLNNPRHFNAGALDAASLELQNNSKKHVIHGTQSREEDGMHYEIGSEFKFKRDGIAVFKDPGLTDDLYDLDTATMEFSFDKKKDGTFDIDGLILYLETEGGTPTTVAFEGANFKDILKGCKKHGPCVIDDESFKEIVGGKNYVASDKDEVNKLLNDLFSPKDFLGTIDY